MIRTRREWRARQLWVVPGGPLSVPVVADRESGRVPPKIKMGFPSCNFQPVVTDPSPSRTVPPSHCTAPGMVDLLVPGYCVTREFGAVLGDNAVPGYPVWGGMSCEMGLGIPTRGLGWDIVPRHQVQSDPQLCCTLLLYWLQLLCTIVARLDYRPPPSIPGKV
eukprot:3198588-Rhodomonas_salina.1